MNEDEDPIVYVVNDFDATSSRSEPRCVSLTFRDAVNAAKEYATSYGSYNSIVMTSERITSRHGPICWIAVFDFQPDTMKKKWSITTLPLKCSSPLEALAEQAE